MIKLRQVMTSFCILGVFAFSGIGLLGSLPSTAHASGSYASRPPKPPTSAKAQYVLGKSIFEGNASLTGGGDAASQKAELSGLQGALPESAKANLTGLAGKLSDKEMSALKVYLKKRFLID